METKKSTVYYKRGTVGKSMSTFFTNDEYHLIIPSMIEYLERLIDLMPKDNPEIG